MVKLHLGCGKRDFGVDWIHIDGGDFDHLYSDDVVNLPFANNSVDLIYASHLLNYFDREEGLGVLANWHMKLKKGGVLRLAVPNFGYMAAMVNAAYKRIKLDQILGPLYGKMKMGDEYIYHKTTYDAEGLFDTLVKVGFNLDNINFYDWKTLKDMPEGWDDCSKAYIPKMDFENGTLISLNIEAIK